ncbi:MAG: DUF4391 domain-containing protein [Bifidobacterium sp.]|uniref:DUF4391 domain-containing protein n=2 Tax=Bifidobacterium TaxID=1678 RepID=A0AB39UI80_9BIFI
MEVAHSGPVSALTLGLPQSSAIPQGKGMLPKQMFFGKAGISARLKQHLVNDISDITALSVLRPSNVPVQEGGSLKEILIVAVMLNADNPPLDALEHIARLRPSGILFVCTRRRGDLYESALAVRRAIPARAGHVQQSMMHVGRWIPSKTLRLIVNGDTANTADTANTMDNIWESLNAQAILGSTNAEGLDERISRRNRIAELRAGEAKLTKDHARAKDSTQRNETYAKLHKVRTELGKLESLEQPE